MTLMPLRMLLLFDAAFLFLLGLVFVSAPGMALPFFHFPPMPPETKFLVAMWGCVLGTMSLGYAQAAREPVVHVAWIQVGIARGLLEAVVGLLYMRAGVITWEQGGLGIVVGGLVAVSYLILYPRGGGYGRA